MTGNCLMGSRPLLVFDKSFDGAPELRLVKQLFKQVFAVPRGHPKSKPFVDHLMSFFFVDGKIWIRNYQITERGHTESEAEKFNTEVIEVGRYFASTRTCSHCGHVNEKLELDERTFVCENCGYEIDRDLGAAITILREGLRIQEENRAGQPA